MPRSFVVFFLAMLTAIPAAHAERDTTAHIGYGPSRPPTPAGSSYERRIVDYPSGEKPGTIIIETGNRYLYLVLGDGKAIRYGIGVGRLGLTWSGVERISRKAVWPSWTPPADMLARDPSLPTSMKGGLNNPLGARALYLGRTEYRIHGTAQPWTIGQAVSSGCIRLTNADVTDLYNRAESARK